MFPVQAWVVFVKHVGFSWYLKYYLIYLRNKDTLHYILVFGHCAIPLDLHCMDGLWATFGFPMVHVSPDLSAADTLTGGGGPIGASQAQVWCTIQLPFCHGKTAVMNLISLHADVFKGFLVKSLMKFHVNNERTENQKTRFKPQLLWTSGFPMDFLLPLLARSTRPGDQFCMLIVYLRNAFSSMDCNPTPLVMPGGLGYTVLIGCIPYWYMEFDLVDPSRGWYQFLTMHLVDSTVNHPSCQRIECTSICQDLSRCLLWDHILRRSAVTCVFFP